MLLHTLQLAGEQANLLNPRHLCLSKTLFKIPKDPPLLARECIGVHSTMERSAGASFGGGMGGFWGRVRVAIYEKPKFPNSGFRNL